LLLDKADFSNKGYKIDKQRFPQNLNKSALSSGKEKKKIDDLINLSNDNHNDKMSDEDNMIDLGEDMLEEYEEEEELEAKTRENEILLVGI
jgi:hypothetical protein